LVPVREIVPLLVLPPGQQDARSTAVADRIVLDEAMTILALLDRNAVDEVGIDGVAADDRAIRAPGPDPEVAARGSVPRECVPMAPALDVVVRAERRVVPLHQVVLRARVVPGPDEDPVTAEGEVVAEDLVPVRAGLQNDPGRVVRGDL